MRGDHDMASPLFIALDRNTHDQRLSGSGIYHIVRDQLGAKSGVKARPHGLRHTAITSALDAFNGDYRKARAFSRHASLDTVRRYDDNRQDHAGQVAATLDSILSLSRFQGGVLHRGTQAMTRVRPRGLSTTLEPPWHETIAAELVHRLRLKRGLEAAQPLFWARNCEGPDHVVPSAFRGMATRTWPPQNPPPS